MKLPTAFALALCFLGSVLAQFESICNYDCVATDVYGPYCGGAVCVYGETDPAQHEQLCSQECTNAILGKPMRKCVYSHNPYIRNLGSETRNMVNFIRAFCDRVEPGHDIVVPAPAPEVDPPLEPFMLLADPPSPMAEPDVDNMLDSLAPNPAAAAAAVPLPITVETPVPVESPTAGGSVTDPMSGASPQEAVEEDGDRETMEDLDEF